MLLNLTGSLNLKWMVRKDKNVMFMNKLEIKELYVSSGEKEIVKGVSLNVNEGEIHLILGKNGSGKSSFAKGVMGISGYNVKGSIKLNDEEIGKLKINERAKKGLFMLFQNPIELEGIKNHVLMRQSLRSHNREVDLSSFKEVYISSLSSAGLSEDFAQRDVNVNFSGGEKKKNELTQMLILKPKFSIIDEIDSGLDVDSVKNVSSIMEKCVGEGMGIVLITHNPSLIKQIKFTQVYFMDDGKIVKKGKEIVEEFEKKGFKVLE